VRGGKGLDLRGVSGLPWAPAASGKKLNRGKDCQNKFKPFLRSSYRESSHKLPVRRWGGEKKRAPKGIRLTEGGAATG